jgi:DNA modification methylase
VNDLRVGDSLLILPTLDAASFDAVVTDPPYGIEFMGVAWDTMRGDGRPRDRNDWGDFGTREHARTAGESARVRRKKAVAFQQFSQAWAEEALRVLKPGGHLAAFGGTRTVHRLACALEDAGFEIRDQVAWLFGQGFPKSRNVGVELGHASPTAVGTALKPGHEPVVVARKPMEGSLVENMRAHGVGGLRIDDCRGQDGTRDLDGVRATAFRQGGAKANDAGRWPANVALDAEAAALLDERHSARGGGYATRGESQDGHIFAFGNDRGDGVRGYGDVGGASRFFYCAKATREEREAGVPPGDERDLNWSSGGQNPGTFQSPGTERSVRNHHPTVKPVELMRWLIRLLAPDGGRRTRAATPPNWSGRSSSSGSRRPRAARGRTGSSWSASRGTPTGCRTGRGSSRPGRVSSGSRAARRTP